MKAGIGKSLRWWLLIVLVAFLGIAGFINGPRDWKAADSVPLKILAGCVTCYGITGIVAAAGLILRWRWAIWPLYIAFTAGVLSATIANLIFAPKGSTWWIMILAFLLGWAFYAIVQYVSRELNSATPASLPEN
jgi:hypothetical protein